MANETDTIWCYSDHPQAERWYGSCATREEAIAEGAKELGIEPGGEFWIDCGTRPDPGDLMPSTDWIIDMAGEKAADNCGEVAEDWPDVTEEEEKELGELLKAWARKCAPVSFFTVSGKPEKITVSG